jgi:hypothetical protein
LSYSSMNLTSCLIWDFSFSSSSRNIWSHKQTRPCEPSRLHWCNNSFAPSWLSHIKNLLRVVGFLGNRLQEMEQMNS